MLIYVLREVIHYSTYISDNDALFVINENQKFGSLSDCEQFELNINSTLEDPIYTMTNRIMENYISIMESKE